MPENLIAAGDRFIVIETCVLDDELNKDSVLVEQGERGRIIKIGAKLITAHFDTHDTFVKFKRNRGADRDPEKYLVQERGALGTCVQGRIPDCDGGYRLISSYIFDDKRPLEERMKLLELVLRLAAATGSKKWLMAAT